MKIFVYGQKTFGKEALRALLAAKQQIVGVAVAPQRVKKDPMVGFAMLHNIPIYGDCDKMRADDFPCGVDLVISAHSHWIISDAVLAKCRYGGIGYHPSLLPRHRGQDAVRWAHAMGDPITGGTIYRLGPKCDGGDILLQDWLFVDRSKDYHALWRELFPMGIRLMCEAVRLIATGADAALWHPQDETFATWEPSFARPRLPRPDLPLLA